jgi:carboxypeptidase D
LQGYDIYITGESFAGQYIPYIASSFLDAKDETSFNLKGIMIYDGAINSRDTLTQGKQLMQHFQ